MGQVGKPAVAVFAMPEAGHFQRLRPLISDLARHGIQTHVFTDKRFAHQVEAAGGRFIDVFATQPLESVDAESVPLSCRYVTYAAASAERVAREVERLGASLVVYDTFAVVGRVVALQLGLPYVNVCNGHTVDPAGFAARLEREYPRVVVSAACRHAVEVLRDRHGIADASPFSFVEGLSPYLNLYCEPPEFLTAAERLPFEPVAFYGSLPPPAELAMEAGPSPFGEEDGLRVYVSFGTVVWLHWAEEALAALTAISSALAAMPQVRGLISVGGRQPDSEPIRALARRSVSVANHVDQHRALRDADVFVTHQGLNSTHEAIFHLVPMISYPFFADQPGLAARCQEFGLAVPLVDRVLAPVDEHAIAAAFEWVAAERDAIAACLAEAREWELDVIASRDSVLERIIGLIGGQA